MKLRNLKKSYKDYKEIEVDAVDEKTYLKLTALYNKFLIKKALEGNEVTLPARLGTISIQGKKSKIRVIEGEVKGLAPDWKKTKELWRENKEAKKRKQLVFHTNSHTDGYRYKWHWSKKNVLVENKILYSLVMTRANKRAASKNIKKGYQYTTKL